MTGKEEQTSPAPALQKELLRRWSFFFTYLLFFPSALQFVFGIFSFSGADLLNWLSGILFRIVPGALFIFAAPRMPRRAAPLIMGIICTAAALFNLLDIFLYVNFGGLFDYSTLHLMLIAPGEEVRGFFQLFFMRVSTWIILLLYPVAGVIIFKVKKQRFLLGLLLLLTALVIYYFNTVAPQSKKRTLSPAARMKGFVENWHSSKLKKDLAAAAAQLRSTTRDRESLIILVIGESHSKRRSSLFGGVRKTTPQLDELHRQKQIYTLDNAVSPHVMTHLALPGLLTLAGNDIKNFHRYPALPDIFRKAGFKVWYVYNQMPDDERSLPFLAAAKRADIFVSCSSRGKVHDSQLTAEVEKILSDSAPRKLLILHLRGSHWKYAETFPPEKRYFSSRSAADAREQLLNEYDDSLRFFDENLSAFIRLAESQKKNGFLLYLPDHGEALYEEENFAGHTDLFPTAASAELPVILWFSETYTRPQLISKVRDARNAPFLSSDLPHLLMELAGIETPVFAPERSVINSRYRSLPRLVSTGKADYDTMKNRWDSTSKRQ